VRLAGSLNVMMFRYQFLHRLVPALCVAAAIASASALVEAQIIRGGSYGAAAKYATPQDFDGSFHYCRGMYTSNRVEGGGMGWWTDYPAADNNFSVRLAELTRVDVRLDGNRQPNFLVIPLSDPLLFRCPVLFMEDAGTMRLSEDEVRALRDYLVKGGFLWVDDFWGTDAWVQWEDEISRVLPPREFPMIDVDRSHPMMHTLYEVKEVPQIPSINFWSRNGGETSERGWDSQRVHFKAIADAHGRVMVVMTHNTDIADSWEREGEDPRYFEIFSPRGYALGVNFVLYAMTH